MNKKTPPLTTTTNKTTESSPVLVMLETLGDQADLAHAVIHGNILG